MDWASVVAAAIAGAVGVGGTIAGARIASKSAIRDLQLSISAENDRANRAEKRRIYAGCIAAFSDMSTAVLEFVNLRLNYDAATATVESIEAHIETNVKLAKIRDVMNTRISEADLVAPEEIRHLLNRLATAYMNFSIEAHQRKSATYVNDWLGEEAERRVDLIQAMRADLGETS